MADMACPSGRAMHRTAPAVLALAFAIAGLAGCGRSEVPREPLPEPRTPGVAAEEDEPPGIHAVLQHDPAMGGLHFEAYAYDCDGLPVAVRPGDGRLTLMLPDRELVLPQVETASGARYAEGEEGFWAKGVESGTLAIDGAEIPCQLDRRETPWVDARARGATFRGLGQEPGWHLEIHPERIVVVTQYGQQRAVLPNPGSVQDPDQPVRRWHATTESHSLTISVEDRACTDVMSGEFFPATVTVTLDDLDYAGCGRDLQQAPQR
jgi:uncharacterized membrane protein